MNTKISHSAVNKFLQCGKSYDYHYNHRLREKTATAFLAFGSAIDNALNAVLADLRDNGKVKCKYKDIFDEHWNTITINKRTYSLVDCTLVGYHKNDFIPEILESEDLAIISDRLTSENLAPLYNDKPLAEVKELLQHKHSIRKVVPFPQEEHELYNIMNYLSLRRKAHLMLDAYVRDIVPKIEEVKEIQYKTELDSGQDILVSYIDAIVKIKGNDHYTIMDNKTSGSLYEQSKVRTSPQLALYCYATGLKHGAFAVMLKNIQLNRVKICKKCKFDGSGGSHKTCPQEIATGEVNKKGEAKTARCHGEWNETVTPEGKTQFFEDEIEEMEQNLVIDNVAEVNDAIKAGVFVRNLNACDNMFGSRCVYYDKCHKGKDDGLEVVE